MSSLLNEYGEPTAFQLVFLKMNFNEFVKKTNVTELVKIAFAREHLGAKLSPLQVTQACIRLHGAMYKYSKWKDCALQHLKLKAPEVSSCATGATQKSGRCTIAKAAGNVSNVDSNGRRKFQLAIARFTLDEFIQKTNVDSVVKFGPCGYFTLHPEATDCSKKKIDKNIKLTFEQATKASLYQKWPGTYLDDLTWKAENKIPIPIRSPGKTTLISTSKVKPSL